MPDLDIRLAAFDWLTQQREVHGDVLPWTLLARGFTYRGERVPLVSQQGIFKPRLMELPLSIRSSVAGPYDDSFGPEGLLRYRYQGTDPERWDNRGLREAWKRRAPLAYFYGVAKGKYVPVWPVFVVADDPVNLTFSVQVDDAEMAVAILRQTSQADLVAEDDPESRRRYVTTLVRRRLHQHSFRERVLRAYREQCALCRLRHAELLDAAHIIPDSEEGGEPRVPNGISLCKLHHAAFDSFFLAITPDYRIEVQPRILEEEDGPMLLHGLQELHEQRIVLPRGPSLKPDPALLEKRYARFLEAGA